MRGLTLLTSVWWIWFQFCLSDDRTRYDPDQHFNVNGCDRHRKLESYPQPDTEAFADHGNLHYWSVNNQHGVKIEERASPHFQKSSLNLLGQREAFGAKSRVIVPEDLFALVAHSSAFVDKTLFIKYFLTQTNHTVVLAPKSFGKATMLSMLKDFFEMRVDASGYRQDSRRSNVFEIFQRLKIFTQEPDLFNEHFANYSVLSLNFGDLNMDSLKTFLPSFRRMLTLLFSPHSYLLQSDQLSKAEKRKFESYTYPRSQMGLDELASGGRLLSQLLFKHFQRRCIVLIDRVDAPANSVRLNEDSTDNEATFNCLTKFLAKLLRQNYPVQNALLTGILSIGNVYTREADTLNYRPVFSDPEMSRWFGFTAKEVRELLIKFNREHEIDGVRRMFGGYRVNNSNEMLYNAKAVAKFVMDGKFVSDKSLTLGIAQLRPVFAYGIFGQLIDESLETETPVTLRLQFHREHLYTFRPLFNGDVVKDQKEEELLGHQYRLLQFLLENGYYTVSRYVTNNAVRIVVPNIEMRSELKRLIHSKQFFLDKFQVKEQAFIDYMIALDKLNKFTRSYRQLCLSIVNIFVHNMPEKASEVQDPLFVYPSLCPKAFKKVHYEINPRGSSDVFIRRNDGAVIIMLLKVEEDSAFEALEEIIKEKRYQDEMEETDKRKLCVGIYIDRHTRCRISYLGDSEDLTKARNATTPVEEPKVKRTKKQSSVESSE